MAKYPINGYPYYNDYDASKQYTHLLAVPGRVAQAREFTQIQSTMKDIIKSIGDSLMKDGDVIEGCQVIVSDDKSKITITSGKVYINGMVLPVEETELPLTSEDIKGELLIGFEYKEELITENNDSALRDPAQGYDNYNQAGCHRIKSSVGIVLNDPSSAILTTLIDGDVSLEKRAPTYDSLTRTLAGRTHDESGSYIVEGMKVRLEEDVNDTSKFTVVVEKGKAYVLGFELKIPNPRRISVDRALEVESVTKYSIPYSDTTDTYLIGLDSSQSSYVESILSVVGEKTHSFQSARPESNTSTVTLPSGYDIIGDSIRVDGDYTKGVDYTAGQYGNVYQIRWSGTEKYPTSDYNITFDYNHKFQQGTEYELVHDPENDSYSIKWIGNNRPNNNTDFLVDYNQYLARKYIVYIESDGNIVVAPGRSAQYGFEVYPESPVDTLTLASIISPPGGIVDRSSSRNIVVSNVGLTRFTMSDIHRLVERVKTIEYDQAVLALQEEARQYETVNDMKGIFTDPLLDFSKISLNYNTNSSGEKLNSKLPKFDAAVDLLNHICYLPIKSTDIDLSYDADQSTAYKYSRTVTLPKIGENVILEQLSATTSFLINPYTKFPHYPELSLDPAVDSWVSDQIIEIPRSLKEEVVVKTTPRIFEYYNYRGSRRADTVTHGGSVDTTIGTRTDFLSSDDKVVEERASKYIRSREVRVIGSYFEPNLKNIRGIFDGKPVSLTPLEGTTAGTPGTVNANEEGNFIASFTIPDNVLVGVREFIVTSDSGDKTQYQTYVNSASAMYQASGIDRTIERTVTTLTKIFLERVTTTYITHNVDPVGQTFVLNRMTMLSGVDLYFRRVDKNGVPVTCEIREVSNGNITSTVYGQKTLVLNTSNESENGSIATRFSFDDPVLIEANKEYAIVVRSTSTAYELWVAELGKPDIVTGENVLSNPYLVGIMLSSSNNSSWTMHQTTDIKFRLVEDVYSNSADILFNRVDTEEFSRVYLFCEEAIPSGTSITWEYGVETLAGGVASTTWKSISPYNIVGRQRGDNIKFRAKLTKDSSTHLSPVIALDSVGVGLSSYDISEGGYYITQEIQNLDSYSLVEVVVDTYTPDGTSIDIYVLTESGGTNLQKLDTIKVSRDLNNNWVEKIYTTENPLSMPTIDEDREDYTCRLFIKFNSNDIAYTPSFRRLRMILS